MRLFCSLIFCCCLPALASSVQAQICNANMVASTPDSQLTDNNDGTITDTKTGLMWKKCMEGVSGAGCDSGSGVGFTWQTALQRPGVVNGSGFAGHSDWRLPNIKELTSIVEEQCYGPAINLTRFPNTPSSVVWSSSPVAIISRYAWYVTFHQGYSQASNRDDYGSYVNNQVRLVRGGQ